jgi:uncharacterized low-complexity protein
VQLIKTTPNDLKGNTMKDSKRTMTAILGTAFVTALSAGSVSAAENPFASAELAQGYQLAAHGEGKCGEGKCGAKSESEGKCGEGKCGAKSDSEGKCGAKSESEGKCGEGKCGAKSESKAKHSEGKCGEGKCGGKS